MDTYRFFDQFEFRPLIVFCFSQNIHIQTYKVFHGHQPNLNFGFQIPLKTKIQIFILEKYKIRYQFIREK